jgi:hypothetical protein
LKKIYLKNDYYENVIIILLRLLYMSVHYLGTSILEIINKPSELTDIVSPFFQVIYYFNNLSLKYLSIILV